MGTDRRSVNAVRPAAALFILVGAHGVVDSVLSIIYGGFHISISVLGLFVGVGLLRARRSWRTCALVLSGLRLLLTPIAVAMILAGSSTGSILFLGRRLNYQSDGLWLGLAWTVAWFLIGLWQVRVLTRPEVRRRFGLAPGAQLPTRLWVALCAAVPLVLGLVGAVSGLRFSPTHAARAHFAVPDEAVLVDEVDLAWGKVSLFEGGDTFYAVGSYRAAGLWRSPVRSSGAIRTQDAVQTLAFFGWAPSVDRQVTVLAVRTSDPRVVVIEARSEDSATRQSVIPGELIVFYWPKTGLLTAKPYAVALDADDRVLYEYRYRLPNILVDDELRWYPVETVASAG